MWLESEERVLISILKLVCRLHSPLQIAHVGLWAQECSSLWVAWSQDPILSLHVNITLISSGSLFYSISSIFHLYEKNDDFPKCRAQVSSRVLQCIVHNAEYKLDIILILQEQAWEPGGLTGHTDFQPQRCTPFTED